MSRTAALECVLFVAGEPLSASDLASALQCEESEAEALAAELRQELTAAGRGLQLVRIAEGYQLSTRAEHAETVGRLLTRSASRLSRAALEALAVIAYRQPATVPEVEAVRGVSSAGVVKTLLERRLVAEVGRRQTIGRPILYATTREFLHYFGMAGLGDLPPLDVESGPAPASDGAESAEPLPAPDSSEAEGGDPASPPTTGDAPE